MKDKLRIGMQLLGDLDVVRTKLVPCFPPHYDILQFFINQYALIANNQVDVGVSLSEPRWNTITRARDWSPARFWCCWSGWIVSARK